MPKQYYVFCIICILYNYMVWSYKEISLDIQPNQLTTIILIYISGRLIDVILPKRVQIYLRFNSINQKNKFTFLKNDRKIMLDTNEILYNCGGYVAVLCQ